MGHSFALSFFYGLSGYNAADIDCSENTGGDGGGGGGGRGGSGSGAGGVTAKQ